MYYLLLIVGGIAALFFLALFATQFWRLGKYLKVMYPVAYRLYAAFWMFLGFLLAAVVVGIASDQISSKREDEKSQVLSTANDNLSETQGRDLSGLLENDQNMTVDQLVELAQENKDNYVKDEADERASTNAQLPQTGNKPDLAFVKDVKQLAHSIRESRKEGYTDKDIYEYLKDDQNSPYKQDINNSLINGYTDKQISGYLGLKIDTAKSSDKPTTVENMDFLSKDRDLKLKIATARISGLSDIEIYNQLISSKTYGSKFQEAINSGFSKEEICFELGLKPE